MSGIWIEVKSENLEAYQYDAQSQVLTVKFKKTGTVYRYFGVPANVVDGLPHAESVGGYFAVMVRNYRPAYTYERVS